jgi:hypothetical protein
MASALTVDFAWTRAVWEKCFRWHAFDRGIRSLELECWRSGSVARAGHLLMDTLILTRSEVEQALSPTALLNALRDAFAAYSTKRSIDAMRVPVPLPQQRAGISAMLLAPGLVPGVPAYSVKVHGKFPGGNPPIRGVLILHDLETGAPLAILESSYLTALRTGLAAHWGRMCWRCQTRAALRSSEQEFKHALN